MTTGNTSNSNRKKVIIDTDVDIDGWMAMLYLLNHPEIKIARETISESFLEP